MLFPDEISEIKTTYSFNNSETSWELSKEEILALKDWVDTLELRRIVSRKGDPFAGRNGWTFDINNDESIFSCFLLGNSVIFIDLTENGTSSLTHPLTYKQTRKL